jgi:hypothetical protein
MVADNGDPDGFDPWHLVMTVLNSELFGRLIGIERVLVAVNISVTAFVSYPGDPDVCNTGLRIGPYTFAGDVDSPVSRDEGVDLEQYSSGLKRRRPHRRSDEGLGALLRVPLLQ